ncbi:hypothetical protein [Nonomuraea dietziae]|uniref:hypothetical protein n=1 Tax=Nonomuraea dietziae TaxID=65515 RepID=UPI00340B2BE8
MLTVSKTQVSASLDAAISTRRLGPWPLLLFAGYVTQFAVRVILAWSHPFPVLIPDESGYLLAARLLSGGAPSDLSWRPLYQGGYSLVIAPAYLLSDDPLTVYRIVLVINALIGASLLFAAMAWLQRLGVSRRPAYVVAMATALLPAMVYYGQFAIADAILPLAVTGWLLCLHSWIDRRHGAWAIAASALAAYTYSAHPRGVLIVVIHAGVLGAVLVRRWADRRDATTAISVLVAGTMAGWALNTWLRMQIYPGGVMSLGDWLTQRLTSMDGWGWTLSLAAGKIWYLIASTWGLAGVGLVATLVVLVRREMGPAMRASAGCIIAAVAGIALVTSAAVPDEGTVANFAYGRYLVPLVPALFLSGAAVLLRAGRDLCVRAVAVTAGVLVFCALVVWGYAGRRLKDDFFGVFDFPEIAASTWSWTAFELGWATCLALLALAAVGASAWYTTRAATAATAVFIAIGVWGVAVMAVVTPRSTNHWSRQLYAATDLKPAGLTPTDVVALDYRDMPWRVWVSQAFQVPARFIPINRDHINTVPSNTTLVIVPWDVRQPPLSSWPAAPLNFAPVAIRNTSAGAWVAWRRVPRNRTPPNPPNEKSPNKKSAHAPRNSR